MAIRIRRVDGLTIAICAARSVPKEGDIYLDDGAHHALAVKFHMAHYEMGFMETCIYEGSDEVRLMAVEESNNPNRDWWDREYGSPT